MVVSSPKAGTFEVGKSALEGLVLTRLYSTSEKFFLALNLDAMGRALRDEAGVSFLSHALRDTGRNPGTRHGVEGLAYPLDHTSS